MRVLSKEQPIQHDSDRDEMVVTLALTCVLSPGERISPITLPVIRLIVRQIQSRELQ
jgi:hypothetical protein